jgi:hypothetical protein
LPLSLGHVGRRQAHLRDEAGRALALAGLVMGWFLLALVVLFGTVVALLAVIFSGA